MRINLIIGAGQLGSRHLQGMLKWKGEQKVYVLDPFEESLKVASSRAAEVEHDHEVLFVTDIKDVPRQLNLVIVATQSNIREKIVENLLNSCSVEFLILEKVLFQEVDAYHRVNRLIQGIPTWVNHPRRMFSFYQELKQKPIMQIPNKIFSVQGTNWGLGCNGLHFIDLFMFLTTSKLKSLNTFWVDQQIIESKRNGYIEFTGSLLGELDNGDKFIITSQKGHPSGTTICVSYEDKQFVTLEGGQNINLFFPDENPKVELNLFAIKYQSSLTEQLCADIFETGTTNLPSYDEACQPHILFIEAFLEHFNKIQNTQTKILAIT